MVIRGYDNADKEVVLYRGGGEVSITAGKTTVAPAPARLTGMSGSASQVLLAEGTAAVTDKAGANVRDHVSYSGLTITTSASRANGGCTDTDALSDLASGPVSPRNSASPLNVCPKSSHIRKAGDPR